MQLFVCSLISTEAHNYTHAHTHTHTSHNYRPGTEGSGAPSSGKPVGCVSLTGLRSRLPSSSGRPSELLYMLMLLMRRDWRRLGSGELESRGDIGGENSAKGQRNTCVISVAHCMHACVHIQTHTHIHTHVRTHCISAK